MRYFLLAGVALVLGCPVQATNPNAPEAPGFDPCTIGVYDDRDHWFCPDDGWPWGETLRGRLVGTPGIFGGTELEDGNVVEFRPEDGSGPHSARFLAHFFLGGNQVVWWDETEEEAPLVDLTVSAPCTDVGLHYFEVTTPEGVLLVAGGSAPNWSGSSLSISAEGTSDRCAEPVPCDCWDGCLPAPVEVADDDVTIALLATERTRLQDQHIVVLESWVASGTGQCTEAPERRQRWIVYSDSPW